MREDDLGHVHVREDDLGRVAAVVRQLRDRAARPRDGPAQLLARRRPHRRHPPDHRRRHALRERHLGRDEISNRAKPYQTLRGHITATAANHIIQREYDEYSKDETGNTCSSFRVFSDAGLELEQNILTDFSLSYICPPP